MTVRSRRAFDQVCIGSHSEDRQADALQEERIEMSVKASCRVCRSGQGFAPLKLRSSGRL